jgi:hypothetical protein
VLNSADPLGLAAFYERFLGWPIADRAGRRPGAPTGDGWAILRSPDGTMKVECQFDGGYVAPTWPAGEGDQRMMVHVDLATDDLGAAVQWALECGAQLADHQPQPAVRVMLDPAGHPFCLFERGRTPDA